MYNLYGSWVTGQLLIKFVISCFSVIFSEFLAILSCNYLHLVSCVLTWISLLHQAGTSSSSSILVAILEKSINHQSIYQELFWSLSKLFFWSGKLLKLFFDDSLGIAFVWCSLSLPVILPLRQLHSGKKFIQQILNS